ncbi:hypothetical protein DMN91_005942 [Ooceraea biroi]|uniref:Uncharacterized protein n=1 Tax=Ooceraea biroi TaxID=2015173 RepID=A0A3L8DNW2_OOCBI|nr:hypothetical protein DMN91_005942 [Ooceraea biroi]
MNSTTKRTDQNGSQETSTTRTRLSSFSYNKTPAEAGNRLSSFVMRTSNLSNRKDDKSPLASTEKLSISSRQEHFGSDKASNEKPALSSRQENFGSDKASDHNWTQGQSDGSSHFLAKADGDNYVDNNISNIPALISDAEIKKRDFDATSESSLLAELNNASAKTFVMPMQEVIVANIHTNYDSIRPHWEKRAIAHTQEKKIYPTWSWRYDEEPLSRKSIGHTFLESSQIISDFIVDTRLETVGWFIITYKLFMFYSSHM